MMHRDFDRLYRDTPEALGPPSRAVEEFFAGFGTGRLRVLDLGCGQGRNALAIARRGHAVLGVDIAPAGLRSMTEIAREERLDLRGHAADLAAYVPEPGFDVVLFDRVLHLLPGTGRLAVLRRALDAVVPGGWCLILDERVLMDAYRRAARSHPAAWEVEKTTRSTLFLRRAE